MVDSDVVTMLNHVFQRWLPWPPTYELIKMLVKNGDFRALFQIYSIINLKLCIYSVPASVISSPGNGGQEVKANELTESDISLVDINPVPTELLVCPLSRTELLPWFLTNIPVMPLEAGLQPDALEECLVPK